MTVAGKNHRGVPRKNAPTKNVSLQCLFESHLRARSMLKAVSLAEADILTKIVKALKCLPKEERKQVVVQCIESASAKMVMDPMVY